MPSKKKKKKRGTACVFLVKILSDCFSEVEVTWPLNKYLKACKNFVQDSLEMPGVGMGEGTAHSKLPLPQAGGEGCRSSLSFQEYWVPSTSGDTGRRDAPIRVVLS